MKPTLKREGGAWALTFMLKPKPRGLFGMTKEEREKAGAPYAYTCRLPSFRRGIAVLKLYYEDGLVKL